MSKIEIPQAAADRCKVWIKAITETLEKNVDKQTAEKTMRAAGKSCAEQLLSKTIDHFGRRPESVAELVEAINKRRRECLDTENYWRLEEKKAFFKLDRCGCDLVESCLADPGPTFCQCSAGMFENLFKPFCTGEVHTEIVKAIGMGNDCCEFIVHFEE